MSTAPKVVLVRLSQIRPTPENDDIYSRLSTDDPDVRDLIADVRARGVMEPMHVSSDGYVISGHRRRFAAMAAGVSEVPVIYNSVSYEHDRGAFLKMLTAANKQRKKTTGMLLRETLVNIDAKAAHEQIVKEREEKNDSRRFFSDISDREITPGKIDSRKQISKAKIPLLEAALKVLNEHREYWPLSVRQVHYRLLGADAPLKHASKSASKYINDKNSYRALVDILARGRIDGYIPWEAIDDETRPEELNNHYWNPAAFFKRQVEDFLVGYGRNKQQSQPNHIEIIAEKLTVRTILSDIAQEYSIPLTINRGMSGPTVKKKIVNRFKRSRKEKLILLVVSDLDPAGDCIAEDIRKAFERDFGVPSDSIEAYKVALSIDQVEELSLEPSMDAKSDSPTYDAFVERYGITDAYELEALEPADLRDILDEAIRDVMDTEAYQDECDREEDDAKHIVATRNLTLEFLKGLSLEGEEA